MAPEASPVEKVRRRAKVGLGIKLDPQETAYLAAILTRQNLAIQTLTGLVKEYERALGEGHEEE